MQPDQDDFFNQLFLQDYEVLMLYAIKVLYDSDKAADCVQDTFQEAIIHIDELMIHPNPSGWLMTTLRNKCKNHNRSYRRYLFRFSALEELPLEPISDCDISKYVDCGEEDILYQMRQTLTEDEWKLMQRIVFDHVSHQMAAEELRISKWALEKRIERIRKKLDLIFPGVRRRKK